MNSRNLTVLLQRTPELAEQTRFCPGNVEIAEFYEAGLGDTAYMRVQRHVADCPYCQNRIGMLARLETTEADVEVPEHLLASAKQLGGVSKPWKTYRAPVWAAAAMVVLALYVVNGMQTQVSQVARPLPAADLTDANNGRQLRGIDQPVLKPKILTPAEGALVSPDDLVIRWTEIPGSLYYELYIMSDAGDLLLDQRVEDTQWSAGPANPFSAGGEYYLRVEAQLPDSRSVSTDHVLLRIEG